MTKPISTRFGLGNLADLTTPTEAQNYTLGEVVEIQDSASKAVSKYMYCKSHEALTQYEVYVVDYSSTAGSEVISAACATMAAPGRLVIVPQVAVTSGYYFWGLIEGEGHAIMTAETYAVGDHLQVLNAGDEMVVDGTSGSTAFSVNSCAICKEAGTTAVARDVYLFGRWAVVAAS